MIDSVIFRIHDLQKHQALVHSLRKVFTSGIQKMHYAVKEDEINKSVLIHGATFIDHSTGNRFESSYRNFIKSHHYNVAYSINTNRDFIEFNFSIPKFCYSTNVFQMFPHHYTHGPYLIPKRFGLESVELADFMYDKFFDFITRWIDRYVGLGLDTSYISIKRIDFTFNRFFETKEMALIYLNELRRIKKKHLRDTTAQINNYHSGIYVPGKNFTFKIYHKGTEYKVHDYNKVKKLYGEKYANTVLGYADKVLRYEVEFWDKGIDYIFKNKVLGTSSKSFRKFRRRYNSYQKHGYYKVGGVKVERPDIEHKNAFKAIKSIMNHKAEYRLFPNDESDYTLAPSNTKLECIGFSKMLWRKMYKYFWSCARQFDPKSISGITDIVDSTLVKAMRESLAEQEAFKQYMRDRFFREHSEDYMKKISFKTFKIFAELLRTKSWDEIKESGLVSERVYYRYRKFFAFLGHRNVISDRKLVTGSWENSLSNYHWFVMQDWPIIQKGFKLRIM